MKLNKYIDHTLLKATATPSEIIKLCTEAKEYNFFAVCVNGCFVSLAKEEVINSQVKVAAVIGFPLGAMATEVKVFETKSCIDDGADEIDMVINIGMLQSGNNDYIEDEILAIKKTCGTNVLKVIIETCLLNKTEKISSVLLAKKAGADFVKTSTGMNKAGATIEDVKMMREIVGPKMGVKAAGGIRDYKTAFSMLEAGANRIGASQSIKIANAETE